MASTDITTNAPEPGGDLAVLDPGGFLALNHDADQVKDILSANLGRDELTPFDLTRIRIPGSGATTWQYDTIEGTKSVDELTGIVVHYKRARGYWPGEFRGSQPPQCSSADGYVGVGDPGGDCETCEFAQFGSGKADRGQACKQMEQWFLLTDGLLPVLLTLPPTSLRNAKQYRLRLASAMLRLETVLTSVKLATETNPEQIKYAYAVPKVLGRLADDEARRARAYADMLRPVFDRTTVVEGDVASAEGRS